MSHTKNANTFFPDDRVKITPKDKTATAEEGKVASVNADGSLVKVKYADGRAEWAKLEDVEKLG